MRGLKWVRIEKKKHMQPNVNMIQNSPGTMSFCIFTSEFQRYPLIVKRSVYNYFMRKEIHRFLLCNSQVEVGTAIL